MELHTLKEKELGLLSRKRITLMIEDANATPSRLELTKAVANKYKVDEDLVVIKHIYPQFGKKKAKLIVHLYDDKTKLAMFEHKNLIQKHKAKEAPKEGGSQ